MSGNDASSEKNRFAAPLIWIGLAAILIIPLAVAASSPYLASRGGPYIVAGFAGIACLCLFLVQPLLAAGYLPGSRSVQGRRWHRRIGAVIAAGVALHVGGLYVTSPPDTIDALLFTSPTSFSVFGVVAMWGVFVTAALMFLRRKLGMRSVTWRTLHNTSIVIIVISTVIHALLIQGTMGAVSKLVLCVAVLVAMTVALVDLRIFKPILKSRVGQKPKPKPLS